MIANHSYLEVSFNT